MEINFMIRKLVRPHLLHPMLPPHLRVFFFTGKLSGVKVEVTKNNLRKLIEMDPPHHLPAEDIDTFVDFLLRMVKVLPHERETPAQLLKHSWLRGVATQPIV
jgi:hypothetical protein